jgi:hypothetical protein
VRAAYCISCPIAAVSLCLIPKENAGAGLEESILRGHPSVGRDRENDKNKHVSTSRSAFLFKVPSVLFVVSYTDDVENL